MISKGQIVNYNLHSNGCKKATLIITFVITFEHSFFHTFWNIFFQFEYFIEFFCWKISCVFLETVKLMRDKSFLIDLNLNSDNVSLGKNHYKSNCIFT